MTNSERNSWLIVVTALAIAVFLLILLSCYLLFNRRRSHVLKKAKDEAKKIKMEAIAAAKIEATILKNSIEEELFSKRAEIEHESALLEQKKIKYFDDLENLNLRESKIVEQQLENNRVKNKLSVDVDNVVEILEKLADMSSEEAKERLLIYAESTYIEDIYKEIKTKEEFIRKNSREIVLNIIMEAMEKSHVQIATEKNTTIFKLEDDSWKGKIIGREGRNVKTFQQYGGVDIIIDEVPNRIVISSFNPLRREIAYNTLTELIKIGRLQPAAIEETLISEEQKIQETFFKTGNQVTKDLNIFDLDEEIILNLGKLKYRFSYGQSVLQHSIEVAKIAKSLANALELDEQIALKAGLLHDIGKAMDFEQEGSHVELGSNLLKMHKIDNIIVNCVESHHGDVEKKSVYAEIISIADTISAARFGARNNGAEQFFERLKEVETECEKFYGVLKAYVFQSGRQIRVIVNPDIIQDHEMLNLTQQIKEKIKSINKTPGDIYITLIREKRESTKL
ncbi:Rnase Y domain-containing protein [Spiroplasma tabanidicola]|uniref:Ribonuclease Y n=1 Tax=Spiroplasma tabanidicola TaxID=324079 RepID=A0A6I6C9Z6_9MOLU|nr:Rnase Y domain-containing protein [Spiroplasma tabanidicola]QGS51731.1 ribonuclease Y [Spiroplasma tabanidicola]